MLAEHGERIGAEYAAKRRANASHRYRWRPDLHAAARAALGEMTQQRCAYCDGYPFGDMGEEQIDHFRPKSRDEFYELVCAWENLFLICAACNKAKLDAWHEDLLRPDLDFAFERFFEYRELSGEILPRPDASIRDRGRASRTIELLDLNRSGKCFRRRETVRLIRAALREGTPPDEIEREIGHRFLIPLCT